MTDEIRKKAIEKSRELYPEETEIFECWEKHIKIYNAGFGAFHIISMRSYNSGIQMILLHVINVGKLFTAVQHC